MRRRILVADHEMAVASNIARLFDPQRYVVRIVTSCACCLDIVRCQNFMPELVLLDADLDGLGPLCVLPNLDSDTSVLIMCESPDAALVSQASKIRAVDIIGKPATPEDLARITDLLDSRPRAKVTDENGVHVQELGEGYFFLAASPAMREIWRQAMSISRIELPVLITGESGSGKEVIARLIKMHSARASRRLLKVNCAALPADLLESELFGYEAGAFTGAMKSKPGMFEQCSQGTILLDEIGEMSPPLQAKLLHVLQDGQFSRLGSRATTRVDVRVLAATNVDIAQALAERRLREDLYYRLSTFVIHVPSLRERPQEIPYLLTELTTRFAADYCLEPVKYSPRLIAAAISYHWPGNLRELGNFVKRYLIMRDETAAVVELESKECRSTLSRFGIDLPGNESTARAGLKSAVRIMKNQTESKIIRETLDQTNWNRRVASEKLRISYKALLYKIRQYKLAESA